MSLASISIKRPVLAIVMSLTIILFGIISFQFLGVREYPAIDPPIISVRTSYVGANADVIESQITEPLEKAINGIAGVSLLMLAEKTNMLLGPTPVGVIGSLGYAIFVLALFFNRAAWKIEG